VTKDTVWGVKNRRTDLRTARKRARLTQVQLAQLAGVQQSLISKLESGELDDPRLSVAESLALALHVDLAELRFSRRDDAA